MGMQNATTACKYMPEVVAAAKKHNVKPEVLVGLIHVESRWTPSAVSHANACGLTQVIPKWTGGRASSGTKYTCEQLKDPVTSIWAGAEIFSFWRRKYGKGNYTIGLCGYNAGYRCKAKAKPDDSERITPSPKGMRYARLVLRKARTIKRKVRKISRQRRKDANIPSK